MKHRRRTRDPRLAPPGRLPLRLGHIGATWNGPAADSGTGLWTLNLPRRSPLGCAWRNRSSQIGSRRGPVDPRLGCTGANRRGAADSRRMASADRLAASTVMPVVARHRNWGIIWPVVSRFRGSRGKSEVCPENHNRSNQCPSHRPSLVCKECPEGLRSAHHSLAFLTQILPQGARRLTERGKCHPLGKSWRCPPPPRSSPISTEQMMEPQ